MARSWYGPLSPTGDRPQRRKKKKKTTKPFTPFVPQYDPYAGARDSVNDLINTLLQDVYRQRDDARAAAMREADMEYQRGQSIAQGLKDLGISDKIQQGYQSAAGALSGLAQGYSGHIRDTASADAAQQQRMLSGTGQEGAVRNQGENMGNVIYGQGGAIPAGALVESGAAFAADAALQPGFALQFGQLAEAERRRQWAEDELPDFTSAIEEVLGKRVGLTQDAYERVDKTLEDDRDYRLKVGQQNYSRLKSERDFLVKQAYLALAQGDRKRSNEYLALAREKELRMQAKDQGYDVNGNLLPGFKQNPDGTVTKLPKPKSPKDTRGKARQEREEEFRKARLDAIDEAKKLITPATTLRPEQRPSWQVAYSKLWNRYKDLLRFSTAAGKKKTRARIDQLIREALTQNGFVEKLGPPAPGKTEVGGGI